MTCPKCGNNNVNVNMVQSGMRTSTKKKGCLYTLARWTLIICTLGLWLVFGKKKATSKTEVQYDKMAVCNNCGNTWKVG